MFLATSIVPWFIGQLCFWLDKFSTSTPSLFYRLACWLSYKIRRLSGQQFLPISLTKNLSSLLKLLELPLASLAFSWSLYQKTTKIRRWLTVNLKMVKISQKYQPLAVAMMPSKLSGFLRCCLSLPTMHRSMSLQELWKICITVWSNFGSRLSV